MVRIIAVLGAAVFFTTANHATACEKDDDCKGSRVCSEGICMNPAPAEPPSPKAETEDPEPESETATEIPPQSEPISVKEEADQEDDSTESFTGIWFAGWLFDMGAGGIIPKMTDSAGASYVTFGPKIVFGLSIIENPVRLELGISAGPPERWKKKADYSYYVDDRYVEINADITNVFPIAILARLLFGIRPPKIYWTVEFEPALSLGKDSTPNGLALALRGGFAFFVRDWLEFRVNPIGAKMLFVDISLTRVAGDSSQEDFHFNDGATFIVFSPSVGVVLRI